MPENRSPSLVHETEAFVKMKIWYNCTNIIRKTKSERRRFFRVHPVWLPSCWPNYLSGSTLIWYKVKIQKQVIDITSCLTVVLSSFFHPTVVECLSTSWHILLSHFLLRDSVTQGKGIYLQLDILQLGTVMKLPTSRENLKTNISNKRPVKSQSISC